MERKIRFKKSIFAKNPWVIVQLRICIIILFARKSEHFGNYYPPASEASREFNGKKNLHTHVYGDKQFVCLYEHWILEQKHRYRDKGYVMWMFQTSL